MKQCPQQSSPPVSIVSTACLLVINNLNQPRLLTETINKNQIHTIMKIQLRLIMLTLLCAVAGTMWGATTYFHTFAQSDFSSTTENGTKYFTLTQDVTLSNVDWKLELTPKSGGDKVYMGNVHDTKGLQFGSGNYPASSIKLSTSGISGTIKSVIVNTSGASQINGTVKVSVSGTPYKCDGENSLTLTATATDYTFTGSASGKILIEWSQTSSKAIYIKDVTIEYEGGSTITVAAPTFPPAAGAVKAKTPVTITAAEGCTLSYTVNDVAQTASSNTAEVSVTVPTTIKAKAVVMKSLLPIPLVSPLPPSRPQPVP